MSFKNFKISVANALMLGGKVNGKRGRPSLNLLLRKKRRVYAEMALLKLHVLDNFFC